MTTKAIAGKLREVIQALYLLDLPQTTVVESLEDLAFDLENSPETLTFRMEERLAMLEGLVQEQENQIRSQARTIKDLLEKGSR